MRDNGYLVNDVTIKHRGLQQIVTPNGVQLPLITNNGLMYLEHYYPTVKQMLEINREEFMTSKNTWDPSKLDDIKGTTERLIKQLPLLPSMLLIVSKNPKVIFVQPKVIWKLILLSATHHTKVVKRKMKSTNQNLEKRRKRRKENG